MSKKTDEWDEYFSIHCHLPAAAIRDLFDEIERLSTEHSKLRESRKQDCVDFFRWFWNAPGTNAEQGYDEWRAEQGQSG